MEHSNGKGIELNPSEKAKLRAVSIPVPLTEQQRAHVHVNINLFSFFIQGRLDIECPKHPCDIDGDGCGSKMHPGADTAAPTKGAVAQCARVVVSLLEEALWPELVGLREV